MRTASDDRPPCERIDDLDVVEREMVGAVRDALALHRRLGQAVPIWENGRVRWVAPEDIPVGDR
jgi:hypothetical protein